MLVLAACGKGPKSPIESARDDRNASPALVATVSPTEITTANSATLTHTGGTGPVEWSVVSGIATIDADGVVTASTGAIVLRATDTKQKTDDVVLTVRAALSTSPSSFELITGESKAWAAVGGVAPFTAGTVSGSASASNAIVVAGGSAGTAIVRLTDALGNEAQANVTIAEPVVLDPATSSVATGDTVLLTATGGFSPYTYTIRSGPGTLSANTFSAAESGVTSIRATDRLGHTADATITTVNPLTISPTSVTLSVLNTRLFVGAGGVGPYTYTIATGSGSMTGAIYMAPASSGAATVRVADASGQTATATVTINPALAIDPVSISVPASGTRTFTSSGGVAPYAYSLVSGAGSIGSVTGAYSAPAGAGSAVVRSTDSLGNQADAAITIMDPLTISPASQTLAAQETATFTASGGQAPFAYSIVSGGGTIDPSSGFFTAGASAGTVTIRVTDNLGSEADSVVTVLASLAISPSTVTLAVNNAQTFSTLGGQAPMTYSIVSGGGSINASTGAFTAPAGAGFVTVRATDAAGRESDATVTVNAALAISPTTANILINETQNLSVSGGVPPVTYSIAAGGGSVVAATGVYTAPATAGSATLRATDSRGNTSDSTISIHGTLSILPASATLTTSNTQVFVASGGSGGFVYSVASGLGSIDASTGLFAPAAAGSVTLRATDSSGHTVDATVTVLDALVISPSTLTKGVSQTHTFTTSGGVGTPTFSIVSGGGSIDSSTGAFTAPASATTVTVRATDTIANTSDATVTVLSAVTISPSTKTLAVNNIFTFIGSGGQTPYVYSIASGAGSIHSSTGVYTAAASAGSATVRVTDALGQIANASVTVNAALAMSPASTFAVTDGSRTFAASGGVSPYTFSIQSGDGSIDSSTGVYSAPSTAQAVVVKVTDSLANTATSSVNVVTPLTISPTTANLEVDDQVTLAAAGGQTPYTYSVVSGGGSVDATLGEYTAPSTASTITVRATDALGLTADAVLTSYLPFQLSPTTLTVAPTSTTTFTATGGLGAVTFEIVSGGGGINPSTGDYTAPSGADTVVVRATDEIGNTAEANVTVSSALSISPTTFRIAAGTSKTFSAAGGVAPYTYSIQSGTGSMVAGTYTAPTASDNVVVSVTDSIGAVATANVKVVTPAKFYGASYNNCVIYDDGSLRCFGDGSYGQLGAGSKTDRGDGVNEMGSYLAFIDLGTGRTVKDLAIGVGHICAILDNDLVKCWGYGTSGQLGLGDAINRGNVANQMGDNLPFVDLGTNRTAKKIYAATSFTCAILDDDATKCWGANNYGQLGQGDVVARGATSDTMGDSLPAINLGTGKYAKSLALGSVSVCAILNDDTMKCWGRNNKGQLLIGSTATKGSAAGQMGDTLAVSNLGAGLVPQSLTAANSSFCALLTNGNVKCWGQATNGTLGSGGTTSLGDAGAEVGDALPYVNLGTGLTASAVISGPNSNHVCALIQTTGALKCWGNNAYGQLGQGTTTSRGATAGQMGDSMPATDLGTSVTPGTVILGLTHTCMMSTSKKIKCWGRATNGSIGNASTSVNLGDGADEMGDTLQFLGL